MHDLYARFRKQPMALPVTVSAATLSAILIGSAFAHGVHGQVKKAVDVSDATPLTIASAVDLSTPFARIAKAIGPAVVNINTEILPHQVAKTERGPAARDDEGDDGGDNQGPGMQDFFNRFFGGTPGLDGRNPQQQEERALGSGFIVDPHGYIVTAAHVIEKADRIYVKLSTDPESEQGHRARLVGLDKDTDLAVIKIDAGTSLPTVKLGNSDAAQPGDAVEAIGSPFDLAQTVTAGIVSAKNRRIDGSIGGQFKRFIQTDASINPGNSGGPLLNMDGQVIGVNDAYLTQSTGSMGIGFAIPSNMVVDVYNQLIGPEHKVVRGSIGIGITFQANLSSAVAKMYDARSGVLISSVTPGMAAEKAGLKPNDVIVSVDGKPVKNGDELVETITPRHPGSKVAIGYLRDGQKMTTTCTISDRAEIEQAANGNSTDDAPGTRNANPSRTKLGIAVADLPGNAPGGLHGVVIQSVIPGSFADELRPQIGPGVIIEGINRKPVNDQAQFNAMVAGLRSGDDVVLQIAYPNSGGQSTLTGGVLP